MGQTTNQSDVDFQRLFERIPGLYLILAPLADFTILTASDAYLKATKTRRQEIIGRPLFEIFPDNPNDPDATGAQNLRASLERVLQHRKPDEIAVQKYDIRRPDSEGGGFEERYWRPLNAPVTDDAGRVVCIVHRVEDVTELVRMRADSARTRVAVEVLRESEARLRELADAMPQIVWASRADGSIDYFNERWYELTGMSRGDPLDESWALFVHPDDLARCVEGWKHSVSAGCPFEAELRFKGSSSDYRWFLARALPVRDAAGKIARWYGTCTDIHAAKQLERDLDDARTAAEAAQRVAEAANRSKDQFLAMLSHELRTPLTPVLLTVSLLEQFESLPDEVKLDIKTIRQNVELEARLIDDLLDLTRISRGKLRLSFQTADAHILLRAALELCCAGRMGEVDFRLDAREHHVRADPGRLQQIFWNVLGNADKFTPAGGPITVRTSNSPEGRLVIQVTDTGIGIAPDMLPRVFDAFQQGDESLTRSFGGMGLGLTITRALVESHGGTIEASSGGHLSGATFTIELPTVEAPAVRKPSDSPEDKSHSPAIPLRILLVEDHHGTLIAMTRLLRGLGHHVITASTVKGAIEAAGREPIDLIISDLGLPDGSGNEVMRTVRKRFAVKGIAVSGFGMDEDIRHSAEAGFEQHLVKPVDLDRLQAAIEQLIG